MKAKLLILLFFFSFKFSYSQWTRLDSLVGSDVVNDLIEFKGNIYAAIMNHGVFQSKDNGYSWKKVNQLSTTPKLLIHKDQLYTFSYSNIAKSSDGEIWTNYTSPSGFPTDVKSDNLNIYVVNNNGIYKSADNGLNWTSINSSKTMVSIAKVNTILYAGGQSGILLKSVNEGSSWDTIKTVGTTYSISQICSVSDTIYLSSGSGIYRSTDGGTSWNNIKSSSGYFMRMSIINSKIYAHLNGSIYTSSNGGFTWSLGPVKMPANYSCTSLLVYQNTIFAGSPGYGVIKNTIKVDQPWIVKNEGLYLTTIHRIIARHDTIICGTESSFVLSSFDGGLHWNKEPSFYSSSVSARKMAISGKYLLIGDGTSMERRLLSGTTWEWANKGLSGFCEDIAVNKQYCFSGTGNGVFRSSDFGGNWTNKSTGITSISIRSLFATDSYVFAGSWNGLFLSKDNGESWTDISQNLPGKSINCILYVDSFLYVGTQNNGVYRSSNLGISWLRISDASAFCLSNYNSNIFIGSWKGSISLSCDHGLSWREIGLSFPQSYISSVNFINKEIFAGAKQPGMGLWKRNLYELFPPELSFYSAESDSTFKIGDSLYISSDQVLRNNDTDIVTSAMLSGLISVVDSKKQKVNFTAFINKSNTLISLFVLNAVNEERYSITVNPLRNEAGLLNATSASKPFKAHGDPISDLTDAPSADLLIYPNPVTSKTKLVFVSGFNGIFEIMIYNVSGDMVRQYKFNKTANEQEMEINMLELSAGIYFVKVISKDYEAQKKIIKN